MSSPRSNIMIISTQTSHEDQPGYAPRGSGFKIQQLTEAGLISVHKKKKLRPDEKELFLKHLRADGWLIIVGYNEAGVKSLDADNSISSDSGKENQPINIHYTAEEYVNLVMQVGMLKENDTLHVLLYASYGTLKRGSKASFAEQLANEFAIYNIFTEITATVGTVTKIDYANDFDDIEDKQLRFRINPKDVCHFSAGPNQKIKITEANKNFYITKKKLAFGYDVGVFIRKLLKLRLADEIPSDIINNIIDFIPDTLIPKFLIYSQSHLKSLTDSLKLLTPNQLLKVRFLLEEIIENYSSKYSLRLSSRGFDEKLFKKRLLEMASHIGNIYYLKRNQKIADFVNYKRAIQSILENSIEKTTPTKSDDKELAKVKKNKRIQKALNFIETIKNNLEDYSIEAIKEALKPYLEKVIEIDNKYPPRLFKYAPFRFFSETLEQKLSPFIPHPNPVFVMK